MKKILQPCLLIVLATLLCGCPFDSPYNLDEEPQQNIDESLLGNWSAIIENPVDYNHAKRDPVTINFSKRNEKEYDIAITGNIKALTPYHLVTDDSIKGTAFTSIIAGRQFLNAFIHSRVYIAEIKKNSDSLSILPLTESFTSKYIKNSRELRSAVTFHFKMRLRSGYDEPFALRNLQKVK